MNAIHRILRHSRITWRNYQNLPSPPFLILFINSICNQKCEHCFYWRNLNRRDDLTKDELFALSRSLGRIENLNLSGRRAVPAPGVRRNLPPVHPAEPGSPDLRSDQWLFYGANRQADYGNAEREGSRPVRGGDCRSTVWVNFTISSAARRGRSIKRWRLTMPWRSCRRAIPVCASTPFPRPPT